MKKLILKMSASLDGFVAGPKKESEWIFSTTAGSDRDSIKAVSNASMHLMGRSTYYDMAAWWPQSTDQYAPAMNNIPKAVFTRRGLKKMGGKLRSAGLKDANAAYPNSQGAKPSAKVLDSWLHPLVCKGDLATEIKRLKRGAGRPLIAHGGAAFARSLIKTGLVDEFYLLVHPVILGRGMPIFTAVVKPRYLKLVKSTAYRGSSVALIYRPAKKP